IPLNVRHGSVGVVDAEDHSFDLLPSEAGVSLIRLALEVANQFAELTLSCFTHSVYEASPESSMLSIFRSSEPRRLPRGFVHQAIAPLRERNRPARAWSRLPEGGPSSKSCLQIGAASAQCQ